MANQPNFKVASVVERSVKKKSLHLLSLEELKNLLLLKKQVLNEIKSCAQKKPDCWSMKGKLDAAFQEVSNVEDEIMWKETFSN